MYREIKVTVTYKWYEDTVSVKLNKYPISHIRRTEIVTTMSRPPQAGSTKNTLISGTQKPLPIHLVYIYIYHQITFENNLTEFGFFQSYWSFVAMQKL